MIRKSLLLKLFQGAYIQRWNDKLRPIDFIESDKHGHKMIIAYFLAKCEERDTPIDWSYIIEGGVFEYLQKLVLTDLKSPVFYMIKADKEKYKRLNEFVSHEIKPFLDPIGTGFFDRFTQYFSEEETSLERRILAAASAYASKWEFEIIERADPHGYEAEEIKKELLRKLDQYNDLEGMKEIAANPSNRSFIDLCGQLRYQARWADLYRIPKTSVLTHCFFVGTLSYLYSLQLSACSKRRYNNFFGGLFHDFPEVLTRDIISPIKKSVEGLRDLIIEYEKEQMEKIVYPLLPKDFTKDMRLFTELDHQNRVLDHGHERYVSVEDINEHYNTDEHDPCDGELIKASDELSAFIEAYEATQNGCVSDRFRKAQFAFLTKYAQKSLADIRFRELVTEFST